MNAKEKQKAFDTFMSLLAGKQEVFHSPEGEPFIRAVVNGHGENYPLKKKGLFEDWCRHLYFVGTDVALPQVIFNMMLEQLQAEARFGAPEFQTPLRIAEHRGKIYLDLCDAERQCVEISTQGWKLIDDPPVRFRRSPGMLPLPVP